MYNYHLVESFLSRVPGGEAYRAVRTMRIYLSQHSPLVVGSGVSSRRVDFTLAARCAGLRTLVLDSSGSDLMNDIKTTLKQPRESRSFASTADEMIRDLGLRGLFECENMSLVRFDWSGAIRRVGMWSPAHRRVGREMEILMQWMVRGFAERGKTVRCEACHTLHDHGYIYGDTGDSW